MILINPSSRETLKIFQPFLPRWVPIGIGWLLAVMEKAGIPPRFVDEQVEGDVITAVARHVKEMVPPYIFGFSVVTASFKQAILTSRRLKEIYPGCVILFGGIHPTALPGESLSYEHVDLVLKGEAERPLIELYRCLKSGSDLTYIDNLSYKRDGRIVHNPMQYWHEDLENDPPFPYHLFSSKLYDLGMTASSRGCPYDCIFCSNRVTTGRKYRFRKPEAVVGELDMLSKKYGVTDVIFLDDNFLARKDRIHSMLGQIRSIGLEKRMRFDFQTRADTVEEGILSELYASGFKMISFGIETASEEIMRTINKKETVAETAEAIRKAKKAGLKVKATFIFGLPGDSHRARMDCVGLDRELGLSIVRYNNATPYPGTKLYEIAKAEGRFFKQGLWENFNSVSTLTENPLERIPFSYVPPGNTENEIRRDLLFAYFASYININRIRENSSGQDIRPGISREHEDLPTMCKRFFGLAVLAAMIPLKFFQLFYYSVIRKDTRVSLKFFLGVFKGLRRTRPHCQTDSTGPLGTGSSG